MMRLCVSHTLDLSPLVRLLIRHGASVNERDCNGSTPLHLGKFLIEGLDDYCYSEFLLSGPALKSTHVDVTDPMQ